MRLSLICLFFFLHVAAETLPPSFASENSDSTAGDAAAADSASALAAAAASKELSEGDSAAAAAGADDSTAGGITEKLKNFPVLGESGASLLQLAEEGLGINASKLELSKIVPLLSELQKNIHDHYMVTKGQGKYQPSSLLKRVVSRKSQSRVIRSMKKFAPNTDEGELMQQLDAVTQVLHDLHTNPHHSMQDILNSVSNALGLDLEDEEMQELSTHMRWAQALMQKFLPFFFKGFPANKKADEL
ncbi:hypothetical protein Efla_003644 [Eimeria flavescens]